MNYTKKTFIFLVMILSSKDMSFFKKGYDILTNFIDPSELDIFSSVLDQCNDERTNNGNFLKITNPYLVCPEIIDLALSPNVSAVFLKYLGKNWAIGTCNLRRNYPTSNEEKTVSLFHRDDNSRNFLKMFFYLNDVNMDGGPFTYVETSHIIRKEKGWTDGSRWSDEQIEHLYGKEKIKYLTANKGDVILANTTGFHKGLKCRTNIRSMLTINFTTEQEKFGRFKMKREQFDSMNKEQKYRCRFMELV